MKCCIGGEEVEIGHLIYRDLGYGSRVDKETLTFQILINDEELLARLSDSYAGFSVDCKWDDQTLIEPDISELKDLGYPSLDKLLAEHRLLLATLMKDYLYFHVLDALTGHNPRSDWRFTINLIEQVVPGNGSFCLVGHGYMI